MTSVIVYLRQSETCSFVSGGTFLFVQATLLSRRRDGPLMSLARVSQGISPSGLARFRAEYWSAVVVEMAADATPRFAAVEALNQRPGSSTIS